MSYVHSQRRKHRPGRAITPLSAISAQTRERWLELYGDTASERYATTKTKLTEGDVRRLKREDPQFLADFLALREHIIKTGALRCEEILLEEAILHRNVPAMALYLKGNMPEKYGDARAQHHIAIQLNGLAPEERADVLAQKSDEELAELIRGKRRS